MVWDLTRQNGGVAFGVMKMDQLRVSRLITISLSVSPGGNISTNNHTKHCLFLVFHLMSTPLFTACFQIIFDFIGLD